jgi:cyclohexanecarboxylate-CoA ligase
MQPTHFPRARRDRHAATGEWPQPSLSTLLDERRRADGERPYVIEGRRDGDRVFTYADVARRADRMAVALERLGIRPGDAVVWQLPNWMEGAALAAALDRVGAISVPALTIWRERELGFACRQTGARALVVPGVVRGTDHRELARAVAADARELAHVVTVRADPLPGQHAIESLEADPALPLLPTPHGPHDVTTVFYTSGTTADPKGVLHTPSTLGSVVGCHAKLLHPTRDDCGILQFPLTHVGGVVLYALMPARWGCRAVYVEQFDPELAVDLIERHGVTVAGGPPALMQAMLGAPNARPERFKTVRASGTGAADVSPALVQAIRAQLPGAFVYRSYGLTECPMVTAGASADPLEKLDGTDGRAVPGATVRAVDESGAPVPAGAEGELEVYGPQLCVGYADASLCTAFQPDGFFRTGDLGIVDEGGWVRITGRRKDVIIRKGENLSAKGIEDELAAHPAVAEVAVIGVPDAASGERVCACVVLRAGASLGLDDVRGFMRGRGVMAQKIPEQVEVVDGLPRNAVGKVKKDELRKRFGGSR